DQSVVMAGDMAFFYSSESHKADVGGLFDPYGGNFYPVTMPPEMAAGTIAYGSHSVTTLGDKTYFAGGYQRAAGTPVDLVEIFDRSTGVWSTAHLSVGRDQLAAATVDDKVIFAGGY